MTKHRLQEEYKKDRHDRLKDELSEKLHKMRTLFEANCPDIAFSDLYEAVLNDFEEVYAKIPYVGGASGRMTPFFEKGSHVLPIGRTLRKFHVPSDIIEFFMKKAFLIDLEVLNENERLGLGSLFMSDENQKYLKNEAVNSHNRRYSEDFVYDIIDPDDPSRHDFGIDYVECGFCKLLAVTNDMDLLPYLCATDKEAYELRGINLIRNETLAGGYDRCDFRFKKSERLVEYEKEHNNVTKTQSKA